MPYIMQRRPRTYTKEIKQEELVVMETHLLQILNN